jgi:hypothetical protein
LVDRFIDPVNPQYWNNVFEEGMQGLLAQSSLDQGRRLDQDVVAGYQRNVLLEQVPP